MDIFHVYVFTSRVAPASPSLPGPSPSLPRNTLTQTVTIQDIPTPFADISETVKNPSATIEAHTDEASLTLALSPGCLRLSITVDSHSEQ